MLPSIANSRPHRAHACCQALSPPVLLFRALVLRVNSWDQHHLETGLNGHVVWFSSSPYRIRNPALGVSLKNASILVRPKPSR